MLSDEKKLWVTELYQEGRSVSEIVAETNISRASVYRIISDFDTDNETDETEVQYDRRLYLNAQNYDIEDNESESDDYDNFETEDDEIETVSQTGYENVSKVSQSSFETADKGFETPPPPAAAASPVNAEVEKLRLQLEHEREMEQLRQQGRRQELEAQRLAQEERKLALEETRLKRKSKAEQQQLLQQAKEEQQMNQALLRRFQKLLNQFTEATESTPLNQEQLADWLERWEDVNEEIILRAEEQEVEYEDWLAGQTSSLLIDMLEDALERIEQSFWHTTTHLEFNDEQQAILEAARQSYALDQSAM